MSTIKKSVIVNKDKEDQPNSFHLPAQTQLEAKNRYKTRLIEEQEQLEEKLSRLDEFISSGQAGTLSDVQYTLLRVQLAAMNTYLQCLNERILFID